MILFVLFLVSLVFDKEIINFFVSIRNPGLDWFFTILSGNADKVVSTLFVLSVFLIYKSKRKWIMPLAISFVITMIISVLTKIIFNKQRPFEAMNLALVNGADYNFSWWNDSLPSWHASAWFMAVPFFIFEIPKVAWIWIVWSVLTGISRVYLGVHYLSDVLLGFIIGLGVGYFVYYFFKKKFKF